MRDPNRRRFLFTALIAVLCTTVCPSARGDSILFTTTVTAKDSWHAQVTDGPISGAGELALDKEGYGYISAWNLWAPYIAVSATVSTFAGQLFPSGEIKVGELSSSGEVAGYDTGKVQGTVSFSMTIGETQPLPSSTGAEPSIPFLFFPTLYAGCKAETSGTGTSTCEAEASVSIGDSSAPNIAPASGSGTLQVSGTDHNTTYPTWKINAYAGDTLTINLSTGLRLGGVVFGCGPAGETPVVICGPELGSQADAVVDPLFEFDQQAFDAEMGTNAYSLSDYYQFEFSPNIPDVPHMPTPEPSSLILYGTNLLILVPLLRRRFGRP